MFKGGYPASPPTTGQTRSFDLPREGGGWVLRTGTDHNDSVRKTVVADDMYKVSEICTTDIETACARIGLE
ncbi:hypothetical protein [Streptomyces sp. NPDC088812]|uniref:hypothetical protein n=1 Tax=Streptomyces sp. NPDC088812 TaxID=3365905 RepID=UPI0038266189